MPISCCGTRKARRRFRRRRRRIAMSTVIDSKAKPSVDALRINGERLWDSLMELAKIGATPKGGVCRLTLTDLDRQGRDLVLKWAREAGLTVTIDKIGNG